MRGPGSSTKTSNGGAPRAALALPIWSMANSGASSRSMSSFFLSIGATTVAVGVFPGAGIGGGDDLALGVGDGGSERRAAERGRAAEQGAAIEGHGHGYSVAAGVGAGKGTGGRRGRGRRSAPLASPAARRRGSSILSAAPSAVRTSCTSLRSPAAGGGPARSASCPGRRAATAAGARGGRTARRARRARALWRGHAQRNAGVQRHRRGVAARRRPCPAAGWWCR